MKEHEIESVRLWFKGSHVLDPEALESFRAGRGVFDVGPDDRVITAFVSANRLNVRRDENGNISRLRYLSGQAIYLVFPCA